MLRAVHLDRDAHPKILEDTFGEAFSGVEDHPEWNLKSDFWEDFNRRELRAHMVVRNRFAEDAVAERAAEGPLQYVLLGAGLDSFAYRRPKQLRDVRVFEVDHPATQAWKRRRLQTLGTKIDSNVRLVPMDLQGDSFIEPLIESGFDVSQPAIFSLLGVSLFISEAAMKATAMQIAKGSEVDREIILNFVLPADSLPQEERAEVERLIASNAEGGEPWVSFYTMQAMEALLSECGFCCFDRLTPEEAMKRYFSHRTDGLKLGDAYPMIRASTLNRQ